MKRRDFLKLAGAASVAGCATRDAVQGPRGGRGRRIRRRHGGEVHPQVGPVDRRGAGRARVVLRLLPDLEPGARRLLQPAGHQPRLRRAAPARRPGGARRGHGDRRGEENRAPGARRRPRVRAPGRLAGHRLQLSAKCRATKRRCRPAACCTPGRRARKPWRCASSSSRCATAASTSCPSRWRRTAARRDRTSARAWSPRTSRKPSRAPRCWCSTPTPT